MLPATPENLAEAGIEQRYHEAGGVVVMQYLMPAGSSIVKHVHDYDHLSILSVGKAMLECDGTVSGLHAGTTITIRKGHLHKVTAIDDCIWSCIHAE